jgi:hypothetical protein
MAMVYRQSHETFYNFIVLQYFVVASLLILQDNELILIRIFTQSYAVDDATIQHKVPMHVISSITSKFSRIIRSITQRFQ